ncbi:RraA family protein [Daejeonella sp.]|uniref:RraA family protein n=1 Tax=Daejeonella sp. TaxID=2805397 RepID=UPI0030C561E3
MKFKLYFLAFAVVLLFPLTLLAQTIPREELIFLTSEWKGERFADGRPKLPEDLLNRAKSIGIEEVWQILNNEGYLYQYERNWKMLHDDVTVIGRALTASYMPLRPDLEKNISGRAAKDGRAGRHLHWPINMLTQGDVYVADNRGRVGSLMGDNLANAIYRNSGNGVVFDGFARDVEGLEEIKGFNAFVRDFAPQFLQGVLLMGLNTPVTIGQAIVLPGDLVIAGKAGVVFIPAHMAELVISTAEFIASKDRFGHEMIKNGRYKADQVDTQWSDEIKKEYLAWLAKNPSEKKISREQLDKFMLKRTW